MECRKNLKVLGIACIGFAALQLAAMVVFDMSRDAFSPSTPTWLFLGLICIVIERAIKEMSDEIRGIKAPPDTSKDTPPRPTEHAV